MRFISFSVAAVVLKVRQELRICGWNRPIINFQNVTCLNFYMVPKSNKLHIQGVHV